MDMVDTSKQVGQGLLSVYKKFNYLNIGGYIQPQYQVIQEKGAHTYAGPILIPIQITVYASAGPSSF
jgi:hypothetical protein